MKAVIFDLYETLISLHQSPHYFGTEMAKDIGISNEQFQSIWRPAEGDRSIGKYTLEEILSIILKKFNRYSDELFGFLVTKRVNSKKECFSHLHPEIIPMLEKLKGNVKVGLISNCFSEESKLFKESILFPYFDDVCLSFDEGIKKPDPKIFYRMTEKISVLPSDCIYVGDGGSKELETATAVGMKTYQALWYLGASPLQPTREMKEFEGLSSPLQLIEKLTLS